MKFQNSAAVSLQKGGYLSDNEGNPIINEEFVNAQKRAEFIVLFAEEADGKDFNGKVPDSLEVVRKSVLDKIKGTAPVFFDNPAAPETTLQNQLKDEALAFINYNKSKDDTNDLNNFMQEFSILKDFEEYGLFFKEGVVKLNKIYTVSEIKTALTKVIKYL